MHACFESDVIIIGVVLSYLNTNTNAIACFGSDLIIIGVVFLVQIQIPMQLHACFESDLIFIGTVCLWGGSGEFEPTLNGLDYSVPVHWIKSVQAMTLFTSRGAF